jgi:hypothetical protein
MIISSLPIQLRFEQAEQIADTARENDVAWFYESLRKREHVAEISSKLYHLTEKTVDPAYNYLRSYALAIKIVS